MWQLLADGTPALSIVPALNVNGPVAYDAISDVVWQASGSTSDEYEGALALQRYDYATHQTASIALPAARALGQPARASSVPSGLRRSAVPSNRQIIRNDTYQCVSNEMSTCFITCS